jgi:hypothetical protein
VVRKAQLALALSIEGKDSCKPIYRDYLPNYYAGFIFDPNDHNI